MTLEDVVKEFCRVFRMRREGILPPVDLRVPVSDVKGKFWKRKIDYTQDGITCRECIKQEVVEQSTAYARTRQEMPQEDFQG